MNSMLSSVICFVRMGFLFALCASCSVQKVLTQPQGVTPQQTGLLILYNKQNGKSCQFYATDGQYAFQNNTGNNCPNDTIYSWRVVDGRPGAIFTFKDSSKCDGNSEPSYSFVLTGPTGGVVTTPAEVYLPLKFDGEGGQDVVQGVQTFSHGKTGNMDGKLSCIQIWHK